MLILLRGERNYRKAGSLAGELSRELVNHLPPLTAMTISVPVEQHEPPSSSVTPRLRTSSCAVPMPRLCPWPAARPGCHRSCRVTRIPRCEGKPASSGSQLTSPGCLSTQLRARPQPFHKTQPLGSCCHLPLKDCPQSFLPPCLSVVQCILWLFAL